LQSAAGDDDSEAGCNATTGWRWSFLACIHDIHVIGSGRYRCEGLPCKLL